LTFKHFGDGENIHIIDASGDPIDISDAIWAVVEESF